MRLGEVFGGPKTKPQGRRRLRSAPVAGSLCRRQEKSYDAQARAPDRTFRLISVRPAGGSASPGRGLAQNEKPGEDVFRIASGTVPDFRRPNALRAGRTAIR